MIAKPQKTSVQAEARIRGLGVSLVVTSRPYLEGDLGRKGPFWAIWDFCLAWVVAEPPSHEENPVDSALPPEETEFDRLLAAMPAIAEAINKFNDPETGRAAFDSLMSARGMERKPEPTAPADLRVVQTPAEEAASSAGAPKRAETSGGQRGGSEFFSQLADETGISETSLRDVLSLAADGNISVTPATRKLGTTKAEQARTVIALVASARAIGLGEDPVTAEAVRAEARRKGCYDAKNFANHLGALNGFNLANRNQIVLTSKWLDEFKAAVAKAQGNAGATSSSSTSQARNQP
jgi:hypothetical protein